MANCGGTMIAGVLGVLWDDTGFAVDNVGGL